MKRSTRRVVVATAFLAVCAVGVSACQSRGCRKVDPAKAEKFSTWMVDDVLDDLDANDRQRAAIHTIRKEVLKDALAARESGKAAKAAIAAELQKDAPDAKAIHDLIDARSAEFTKVAHRSADAVLRAHKVLTPEQRRELAEMIKKRSDCR